jgi:predicted nucleic acid-binding Zn finger protein
MGEHDFVTIAPQDGNQIIKNGYATGRSFRIRTKDDIS